MKPLQISVSFFSTVVITSYYRQNYFYSCLYTLMTIFGIMNHNLERKNDNSKNIIHIVDTFLAHMAFVCILYDSYPNLFMMGGLFNTFVFFILEYIYPKYDHIFHAMIHAHTVFSMNTYFIFLQSTPSPASMLTSSPPPLPSLSPLYCINNLTINSG